MKRTIQIILCATCYFGLVMDSHAQQESMFTQFIYNTQVINPGYTGYKEAMSLTAHHRSQWVGFKGAPSTQTISFYNPMKGQKMAYGGVLVHDKIGPSREIDLQGDFAYRLRLSNRATLSFGAKFSASFYQINLTDLSLASDYYGLLNQGVPTDELYMYNTKGLIVPNVGFGMYYYKQNYFLGLSSPKMLQNKLQNSSNDVFETVEGTTEPTYYLQGGYLFEINRDLKLQPTLLVKATQGAPISAGIFINAIFIEDIRVGAFYHYKESVGLLFQYQLNDQFRVGYSFDLATNKLITTNFGSHEIMLNYLFNYRRKRIIYPRYF